MNLKEILARKQNKANEIKEIEEDIDYVSDLPKYNDEIFISLSIIFLKTNISYTDWRLLLSNFTALPYIKPADRILNQVLLYNLTKKFSFSHAVAKSYFIDGHMSERIQSKMLDCILDEKID